jgi:hypothetical protein
VKVIDRPSAFTLITAKPSAAYQNRKRTGVPARATPRGVVVAIGLRFNLRSSGTIVRLSVWPVATASGSDIAEAGFV